MTTKRAGGYELVDCENTLLAEIGNNKFKRKSVAKTYRLALDSTERDTIDWGRVNRAIVERWSMYALQWIKEQAWSGRCFNE